MEGLGNAMVNAFIGLAIIAFILGASCAGCGAYVWQKASGYTFKIEKRQVAPPPAGAVSP